MPVTTANGDADSDQSASHTSSTDSDTDRPGSAAIDSNDVDTSDAGTPDLPLIHEVLDCDSPYDNHLPKSDELHGLTPRDPSTD